MKAKLNLIGNHNVLGFSIETFLFILHKRVSECI